MPQTKKNELVCFYCKLDLSHVAYWLVPIIGHKHKRELIVCMACELELRDKLGDS